MPLSYDDLAYEHSVLLDAMIQIANWSHDNMLSYCVHSGIILLAEDALKTIGHEVNPHPWETE
jgi:hypothetical protein